MVATSVGITAEVLSSKGLISALASRIILAAAVIDDVLGLLVLAVWALRILPLPIDGEALMGSFLHGVHLPFHEAGDMVFMPFGEFLHILGGTLGQLLVPLVVAGAFLREANLFGAAAGVCVVSGVAGYMWFLWLYFHGHGAGQWDERKQRPLGPGLAHVIVVHGEQPTGTHPMSASHNAELAPVCGS